MQIPRKLSLAKDLQRKSVFLLGPRQTGKSWFIRNNLGQYRLYNLLKQDEFLSLSQDPTRLRQEILPTEKIVIIDEIQRLPDLLNEVHYLIEEHGIHFLLTGSSARKLRRGGVNLLGGRAITRRMHPFTCAELGKQFDLLRACSVGLLPSIYFSEAPTEDLAAYVGDYLQTEIAAEGLVRSLPAFSRFLSIAALCHGKMISFTNIANDAQVPRTTIHEYFEILKDTLIADELPAWKQTQKRKPIETGKLYFFDYGVVRQLQRRNDLQYGAPEFGEAFESFLFHELKTYCDQHGNLDLHYWRSKNGHEVDFILHNKIAIEVKAATNIPKQALKNLKALQEEKKLKQYFLVCREKRERIIDGIHILPWDIFLDRLWNNQLDNAV